MKIATAIITTTRATKGTTISFDLNVRENSAAQADPVYVVRKHPVSCWRRSCHPGIYGLTPAFHGPAGEELNKAVPNSGAEEGVVPLRSLLGSGPHRCMEFHLL